MAQKRQQLKGQPHTDIPSPISVITPEERRALIAQQADAARLLAAAASPERRAQRGRPVLRQKKPMVFELVTQSPTRQSPSRPSPCLPPSCHSPEQLHSSPPSSIHFQLVTEKPSVHQPLTSATRRSSNQPSLTHAATTKPQPPPAPLSKGQQGNKENHTAAPARPAPSKATTSVIPATRPSKPRSSSHLLSASSSIPFRSLRQHLATLPLPLLAAEVQRIHSLAVRPFPILPSLYFASPPLALLLQWLQTVALTLSTSHSSHPAYLVTNFTSSLSDGIVLLLLLHYYATGGERGEEAEGVGWEDIRWYDGYKAVDRPQPGGEQGEKRVEEEKDGGQGETREVAGGEREVGWVGAFSFAELTRVSQTAQEQASAVNWATVRRAVHSLAPELDCDELGWRGQDARLDESAMVVFLCSLSSVLLDRSAEVHAARRVQRWWRRCVQRRQVVVHLHAMLAQARQARDMGEQAEVVEEEGEVSVMLAGDEDEVVASSDAPPPTPSRALRHSLLLLDWHDPTTLQQARMKAVEAQHTAQLEAAALQVQRRWRAKIGRRRSAEVRAARDAVVRLTVQQEGERREAAAVQVQRVYRGWRVRRDVAVLLHLKAAVETEMRVEHERRLQAERQRGAAAVLLQSAVRSWLARRELAKRTTEERERIQGEVQAARQRAAVVLQSHIRGRLERVRLRHRLAEREEQQRREEEAAALVRAAQAEEQAHRMRQEAEQAEQRKLANARRLQAEREERERLRALAQAEEERRRQQAEEEHKRMTTAACTIQRAWRNWRRTARMVEELRGQIAAARVESAAIFLQAVFRGKRARKEVARLREERLVQQRLAEEERVREEKKREERRRLLHRVQTLNATTLQTQLRVFLSKQLLQRRLAEQAAERQRSAALIQACWRGYRERKQTPQLLTTRRTLVRLQHRRTPSQTMEGRTVAALAALQSSQSLSCITRAVHSLSVTSSLASICESHLRPAVPALFSLIRSCNRSEPHTHLLLLLLTTLTNIASHPSTLTSVYHHEGSADVLVEQLQVYRDHGRLMRRVLGLLERGRGVPGWVQGMAGQEGEGKGGCVASRVQAVCELLERKCRSERRLGRAWWGGEEKVRHIREMDDIAKRLRTFLTSIPAARAS